MNKGRQRQKGCPNQASYQAGTKGPIKKKEHILVEKKRKRGTASKTTTTLLSEKKEEAGNVSEERVKGWIHVIRVRDTTH